MNTQLLKLDPPYNIICARNKIAKHVATLIITNINKEEAPSEENPRYWLDMRTYSYPVVEYGDGSPAGDVWHDIEVNECRVIAKAPKDGGLNNRIWGHWFCETLRFLYEGNEYGSTQTPITMYEQLKSLHVDVAIDGSWGKPEKVEVELIFEDYDGVSSIDSASGSELYYNAVYATENENQKQNMFHEILKWAGQYIRILNVQTVFTTKSEQYKELLMEWNEAIEKAAKEYNDRQ